MFLQNLREGGSQGSCPIRGVEAWNLEYLLHKTLPDFEPVYLMMWVNTEETLADGGFMSTNVKNKTQLY